MKIISSILFLIFCEALLVFPGGIVEIVIKPAFCSGNENLISIIAFSTSGIVVLLGLKLFFNDIFLRIRDLLNVSIKNLAIFLGSILAMIILFSLVVFLSNKINLIHIRVASDRQFDFLGILLLFIMSLVVAVVEEIVYRGADLSYLQRKFNPWIAILLISIFFSIGHVQYTGVLSYITAFIFSVLASIIVIKTNTLFMAIGLHCGWNFAYSYNNLFFNLDSKIIPSWGKLFEFFEIGILTLVLLLFLCYYDKRVQTNENRDEK